MNDFIYQTNLNECGFACLKMLLASVHKDERYLYIPNYKNEDKYNLLELRERAKKEGLFLTGYLIKSKNDLPKNKMFILIKKSVSGGSHALLIKKVLKYYSYVYDPCLGKKWIKNSVLYEDVSTGYEILVNEGHTTLEFKYQVQPLLSKKENAALICLESLAILSYFFSAYFVDKNSHFLYPIILVSIGVVFAIAHKAYSYKVLERFDDNYIKYTYDQDKKTREINYRLMHSTKSGLFTSTNSFILSFMSAIAVNTILVLNNYYSIFVLLSSSILVLFDVAFITPKIKKEMQDLDVKEKQYLAIENISKNEYENDYSEIKQITYKIARQIDLKKIVMIFALLIITFAMSAITNNADIYFVLFYFAMCLFTFTSFSNCADMLEKNKDNIINRTKFYDLINKNK